MFNSLFFRLFLALWFVSAAALLLTGIYTDRAIEEDFEHFIKTAEERKVENVVEAVTSFFKDRAENDRLRLSQLNHLARSQNVRIIVYNKQEEVVHDTHDHHQRGKGMPHQKRNDRSILEESTHPLVIDGTHLESVTVIPLDRDREMGFLTPVEMDFRTRLRNSVLAGGAVSLVLSLFLSAGISVSIGRPVYNLQVAAEELKNGNLKRRASRRGPQEIKKLSESFNSMAEHIEKSNYLKKKLTQDISHELRNPVSSLRGYLEAFHDGVLPANQENLEHTLKELERLDYLTVDLHQLALAEVEDKAVNLEPLDLNETGKSVYEEVKPLLEARNIKFKYQAPEQELVIKGDRKLLHAAIKNLLQNAQRHTGEGGMVKLSLLAEKSQNWAVVSVSDNGPGIPAHKLPYIFERFYRADDSRSRDTGGSGLGLSLVKEWTRAMGGDVQVESREGEGSEFKLIFYCKN